MERVLATAVGLCTAVALAQPAAPSLALYYQAPLECPAASAVFAEVKRLRGELTTGDAEPDVRARVRVAPKGSRWSADIETFSRGGAGRRTLEADTCQRAAEAVAVVLSLALANPLVPLPPLPAPPLPPVEPVKAEPPRVIPFVDILGVARFGVLPSPMALAQLGGGVEWTWLRIQARIGLASPAVVEGTTASANVESWFQASLGGCAAVIDATARLELCAAGVPHARRGGRWWLAWNSRRRCPSRHTGSGRSACHAR